MKLSEAIREGGKIRPQAFGTYFDEENRSCALGAASEGSGFRYEQTRGSVTARFAKLEKHLRQHFPMLWQSQSESIASDLWYAISERNDDGMTRSEIADWLEAQGL